VNTKDLERGSHDLFEVTILEFVCRLIKSQKESSQGSQ